MKKSTFWKVCSCILCVGTIAGCSTLRFAPPPPALYVEEVYTPDKYRADKALYEREGTTTNERTKYRDKIVYAISGEIDKNYLTFKSAFFGERAATETSLDIVQIGMGTAGALAGGETANLLSALVTGVAGSRLSFNKNFFKEKGPDLLVSRMDALRAAQWAQIYLKLRRNAAVYTLYEAERDLLTYFEKGSLQAAFQNIVAESGAAQQEADAKIQNQIQTKYGAFARPRAPEAELEEIDALFDKFERTPQDDQEGLAGRIVAAFRKLMPDTPVNPRAQDPTKVDDLTSLYWMATEEGRAEVRDALVAALREVLPR